MGRFAFVPKLQLGNALVSEALLHHAPAMRSRSRIHEPGHAPFVTATIVEWLPIFTTAACCDILVRSLDHCRAQKGLKIHAWVILDNHFHAILAAPDSPPCFAISRATPPSFSSRN